MTRSSLLLLLTVACSPSAPTSEAIAPTPVKATPSKAAPSADGGPASGPGATPVVGAGPAATLSATAPTSAAPTGLPTTFDWKDGTFGCAAGSTCDIPYFSSPGGRIDGAPLAIDITESGAGGGDRYPWEPAIELIGVVLSGHVDVTPIEDGATAPPLKDLGVWSGFRAPGGGVLVRAHGDAPARVMNIYVLRSGKGAVAAKMSDPELERQPEISTNFKRTDPVTAFHLAEVPALVWGGGEFRVHIGWEDPKAPAVVDAVVFGPSAKVPEHVHPKEWECLLALSGEGTITIKGAPRDVGPGTMTCIPPNTKHAWTPRGEAPLVGVQVYTPPGPEQRFKTLAGG